VFRRPTDDPHLSAVVASQASGSTSQGGSCSHHSGDPPPSGEVTVVGHGIPGNLLRRGQTFQSRSTCTTSPSRPAAFDHTDQLDGQLGSPEALELGPRFGAQERLGDVNTLRVYHQWGTYDRSSNVHH